VFHIDFFDGADLVEHALGLAILRPLEVRVRQVIHGVKLVEVVLRRSCRGEV